MDAYNYKETKADIQYILGLNNPFIRFKLVLKSLTVKHIFTCRVQINYNKVDFYPITIPANPS